MPERNETTRDELVVGDYVEGVNERVWKVTRAVWKAEGRYLGFESPGHEPIIVLADERPVTRLIYGAPTEAEAVATVEQELGGTVLAEASWGPDDTVSYFHPPHSALEADAGLLRAHLVRFHGAAAVMPDRFEDALTFHRGAHETTLPDHTHGD